MSTNNANNSGAVDKKPKTTSGNPPRGEHVDAPSGNTNKKADVHFDSTEIGKNKTEYFVNVEGAEERKRAYIEQRKKEVEQAKKEAERKKVEAAEKAKASAKAAEKRATTEKRQAKQKAKAEKRRTKVEKFKQTVWGGKHKFITIAIVLLAIAGVGAIIYWRNVIIPEQESQAIAKEKQEKYIEIAKNTTEFGTELQRMAEDDKVDFEKAYKNACEYGWDNLNSIDDETKIDYANTFAQFVLNHQKDSTLAIQILSSINIDDYSSISSKTTSYLLLASAYEKQGDKEKQKKYDELAYDLQKDLTFDPCKEDGGCDEE